MQTSYPQHMLAGIEGMALGRRMSRSLTLPMLPEIQTIVVADGSPAAAEAFSITVTDRKTGQAQTVTGVSGATIALTLDAMVAAILGNATLSTQLSVSEDGTDTITVTARHTSQTYTISVTMGGSATAVVTRTQNGGGTGLPLGVGVVRGSADGEFAELSATSTANDVVGLLFRTDFNHQQSRALSEDPDAIDRVERGRTYSIMEQGRMYAQPEDTVVPGGPVFLRRALTSGAGRVGRFRGTPAGSAQVATVTPTAAELDFAILIEWTPPGSTDKQSVPLLSANPDGTASQTEICDAFRVAAATAQADGLLAGFAFTGTSTLIITGPAGESFRVSDIGEGVAAVADTTPADVDAIDVSHLFEWESTGSSSALAKLKVKLA